MKYFDTHCHLAGKDLITQADEFVENAVNQRVLGLCIISAETRCLTEVPRLRKNIEKNFPYVVCSHTIGIHPHDAKEMSREIQSEIAILARDANAIGETGLDFHYNHSNANVQRAAFDFHIQLSHELKKPLVIHTREAGRETLEHIESQRAAAPDIPGIIHCFTESLEFARRAVELGYYISFSGIVTFKNADALRDVAKWVPLERMLIETDSPWLAPVPYRGQTNQPSFVPKVFDCVQRLRGEDPDHLAEVLWENSLRVFQTHA